MILKHARIKEGKEIVVTIASIEKQINLKAMQVIDDDDRYAIGVRLFQLKRYDEANNCFKSIMGKEYKSLSEGYLKAIDSLTKRFHLIAMINYKYDDYVQLRPLDENHYIRESDYINTIYLSGKYSINKDSRELGIGYSHYQTWHHKLHKYDLTGSVINAFLRLRYRDIDFRFNYLPSYYWVDSESYLMRHLLNFKAGMSLSEKFYGSISYDYSDSNYFQNNGRDGHTNELGVDASYQLGDKKYLTFGLGLKNNSASHPDYAYMAVTPRFGFYFEIPSWEMKFDLKGELSEKRYSQINSRFNVKRRDTQFFSSIVVSRKFLSDWLSLMLELEYTINGSNIEIFDYQDKGISLSLIAEY